MADEGKEEGAVWENVILGDPGEVTGCGKTKSRFTSTPYLDLRNKVPITAQNIGEIVRPFGKRLSPNTLDLSKVS